MSEDDEFQSARVIIKHLQGQTQDLDAELSVSDRADLTAFQTLIQTALEPATLYTLWVEAESFNKHTQVSTRPSYIKCISSQILLLEQQRLCEWLATNTCGNNS